MIFGAALFGAALAGALAAWWMREWEVRYLRDELRIAQDRLVHAWRDDGAVIPPRPTEVKAPEPLPAELREIVEEWESAESRANEEARLRHLYFERGMGIPAVLRHLAENRG